jgi:hypothetical protein
MPIEESTVIPTHTPGMPAEPTSTEPSGMPTELLTERPTTEPSVAMEPPVTEPSKEQVPESGATSSTTSTAKTLQLTSAPTTASPAITSDPTATSTTSAPTKTPEPATSVPTETTEPPISPTTASLTATLEQSIAATAARPTVTPEPTAAPTDQAVVFGTFVVTASDPSWVQDEGVSPISNNTLLLEVDDPTCPFGLWGLNETVLRQGCDGIDQNCDHVIDECAEDQVPPTIRFTQPPPTIPFLTAEEAALFIDAYLVVSDDCAAALDIDVQDQGGGTFAVTVSDPRCVDEEGGAPTITETILLEVDDTAPTITCGFYLPQHPFHVSGGFDPCEGLSPPFPEAGEFLHIDHDCNGQDLIDVEIFYQIEVSSPARQIDSCPRCVCL